MHTLNLILLIHLNAGWCLSSSHILTFQHCTTLLCKSSQNLSDFNDISCPHPYSWHPTYFFYIKVGHSKFLIFCHLCRDLEEALALLKSKFHQFFSRHLRVVVKTVQDLIQPPLQKSWIPQKRFFLPLSFILPIQCFTVTVTMAIARWSMLWTF